MMVMMICFLSYFERERERLMFIEIIVLLSVCNF
jgi:hypothetical protein